MTFLELCQRLAIELGPELSVNIDDVTVSPATSYGTSTEHIYRMITWIKQAWLEIQNENQDWKFMMTEGDIPLTVGDTEFDIASILQTANGGTAIYDGIRPWVAPRDQRYIWLTNTNLSPEKHSPCYWVPSEHFVGYVDRRSSPSGQPNLFTIKDDGTLVVDKGMGETGWELNFRYRRLPQTLAADGDTPTGLPDKLHMIIVYWAMVEHGDFDEAERQFARAVRNFRRMRNKLRLEQLPQMTMPGTR